MPSVRATLLLVIALMLSACGSSSGDDSASTSSSRRAPARPEEFTPRERAEARVSGTQSATLPRGFGACLEAAGFSSAPPGHGVAAQWVHGDGSVVAVSTDATQMATIAAQFSTADTPARVLDGGVIVGGSGAATTAVRACVAGR